MPIAGRAVPPATGREPVADSAVWLLVGECCDEFAFDGVATAAGRALSLAAGRPIGGCPRRWADGAPAAERLVLAAGRQSGSPGKAGADRSALAPPDQPHRHFPRSA